jgi:hypothetical protein
METIRNSRSLEHKEMTPALPFVGAFALVALGLVGLHLPGKSPGSWSLHIKASLWPPSFEFKVKQHSS